MLYVRSFRYLIIMKYSCRDNSSFHLSEKSEPCVFTSQCKYVPRALVNWRVALSLEIRSDCSLQYSALVNRVIILGKSTRRAAVFEASRDEEKQ